MIDTVRIAELNNELGVVQEGIERAMERRHAIVTELVALLDGHDTSQVGGAVARAASPTTTPEAPDKAAPTATAQSRSRGRRTSPPGASSAATAPALVACPECGKQVKRMGIGTHRRQAHSKRKTTITEGPKPLEAPSGKATYLCSRNCGRSFDSRDRLNAHETQGDCQPAATRPPTDPRFRINGKVPAGYIEGMGQ